MAGSDTFRLVVTGTADARRAALARRRSDRHGGADHPRLQTVVSRQTDITQTPVVVSVGAIKGGIRNNIIPESVEMLGTIRTYDPDAREDDRARRTSRARRAGRWCGATVETRRRSKQPVVNDPALTARMLPSLKRVAGAGQVDEPPYITAAEDFSFFAQAVPSLFVFVGTTPAGQDLATAPTNHSPRFYMDEQALDIGAPRPAGGRARLPAGRLRRLARPPAPAGRRTLGGHPAHLTRPGRGAVLNHSPRRAS